MKDCKCEHGRLTDNCGTFHFLTKNEMTECLCLIFKFKLMCSWEEFPCAIRDFHPLTNIYVIADKGFLYSDYVVMGRGIRAKAFSNLPTMYLL